MSNRIKAVGIEISKEAGAIMLGDFKPGMKREIKEDGTPVTKTDFKIRDMVIKRLNKEFPDHDILTEEGSDLSRKSSSRWICDPVDGTEVFSHFIPTSVFSLALVTDGIPVFGFVYHPFTDSMYAAHVGGGAFLNDEKIHVSQKAELKDSLIGMAYWKGAQIDMGKVTERIVNEGGSVVRLGSITYMGALVACGELSANLHPATSAWDSAALKVIIPEARGSVSDLFGNDQPYDGSIKLKGCIMSNGLVHRQLVGMIRQL
jgi:myo-inositol-1(or 4)-monophosphatase